MNITKILVQYGVSVEDKSYDVLIPLPANADTCLQRLGIDDFDDADDNWDADFLRVLETLIGGHDYYIVSADPETGKEDLIDSGKLSDIQKFLAFNDNVHLVIVSGAKTIKFTRGHEILWLSGFEDNAINSLPYTLEIINNNRIKELF